MDLRGSCYGFHCALEAKLQASSIWNNHVLKVTREGPHKQQRRKGNVETNVTEHTALLKPESKENTDRVSTGQKIEQGMLLVAATEVVSHHTRLLLMY